MKTAREVLVDARELILTGWCQQRSSCFQNGKVCYCASGAIYFMSQGSNARFEEAARKALLDAVRPAGCDEPRTIVDWNDTHGRTKQEVIAAFDRAINSLTEEPADASDRI